MSNSPTSNQRDLIGAVHPGEILMEDFLEGFGITQNKLPVSIGVAPNRTNEIVYRKRETPLTGRSVWRDTSGRPRSSGGTRRRTTSCVWSAGRCATRSLRSRR